MFAGIHEGRRRDLGREGGGDVADFFFEPTVEADGALQVHLRGLRLGDEDDAGAAGGVLFAQSLKCVEASGIGIW